MAAGIPALLPQAERLLELRRVLSGILPSNMRRSCTIANYLQGKIVIFASNSAMAAKLRLLVPDLQEAFSRHALEVTRIDIRVQPEELNSPRKNKAVLTAAASDSLAGLAEKLPESGLKTAIIQLAKANRSER